MRTPGKRPIRRRTYDLWANAMAKKWGISRAEFNSHPYDYASYYNDNPDLAWEHIDNKLAPYQHFPDDYKTADHPTFSKQSTHSGKISIRNPKGIVGGEWNDAGDAYALSPDQMRAGWDIDNTAKYLTGEGVTIYSPHGKALVKPRFNSYARGKDDPFKTGELWNINGSPYYELNNLMYNSSGSRVQFGAGTEENPTPVAGGPAVVTPSRRQRLDHPLLFNLINAAKMTPEQREIYYNAKAGLGSERLAEFFGELTPVGDATDTYRVVDDLHNGLYESAAIGAGLLLLPNFVERPLRSIGRAILKNRPIRKLKKAYSRLNSRKNPEYRLFSSNFRDDIAENMADIAVNRGYFEHSAMPETDRRFIYDLYELQLDAARAVEDFISNGGVKKFGYDEADTQRLAQIFRDNPEYYVHVTENGVTDPLSTTAVDLFVARQTRSRRGVYADNMLDAKVYLTQTDPTRWMRGGDRMRSGGGVYTSNNPIISDRFKSPPQGVSNGYDAVVGEKYLDEIYDTAENRLRRLRDRVERFDDPILQEMLYGQYRDRFGLFLLDLPTPIARESRYVGKANRGTGGYERVYLPNKDGRTIERPLRIESVVEHPGLVNRHGRWAGDIDEVLPDPETFIAKQFSLPDLQRYKQELERKMVVPVTPENRHLVESRIINPEVRDILSGLELRYDILYNKMRANQNRIITPITNVGAVTLGGGLAITPFWLGYSGIAQDNFRDKLNNSFHYPISHLKLIQNP